MKETATTAQGKLLWFGKILGGGVCAWANPNPIFLKTSTHTFCNMPYIKASFENNKNQQKD